MAVYVDDMGAPYINRFGRRLVMCHMIADTREELMVMVDQIGVPRRWLQNEGSYREHFDVCRSKRALAVKAGAVEITWSDLGERIHQRREVDPAPAP